jgi:chromate transporter
MNFENILKYVELFFIFFQIGLFTFGGGYAMIPLFESMLTPKYIDHDILFNYIGLSEMTPGPFAVNVATIIGLSNGNILIGIMTTIGVILPSFIIILIIVILSKKIIENYYVSTSLKALRVAVLGLLLAVGINLVLTSLFANLDLGNYIFNFTEFNLKNLLISIILTFIIVIFPKLTKRKISPLLIILLSALLGIIYYGGF